MRLMLLGFESRTDGVITAFDYPRSARGIARIFWPILWSAMVRRSDVSNRSIKRLIESDRR